jgi:hypothetical protein
LLELKDRSRREQRVDEIRVEADRRQRDAGLYAPLQLQQLDLKIGGRGQIRLLLLEPAQLRYFSRLAPLRRRWNPWLTHGGILHQRPQAHEFFDTPIRTPAIRPAVGTVVDMLARQCTRWSRRRPDMPRVRAEFGGSR